VSGLSSKISEQKMFTTDHVVKAEIISNDGLHCTNVTRTNISFTPKTQLRKFDKKYVDSHNTQQQIN